MKKYISFELHYFITNEAINNKVKQTPDRYSRYIFEIMSSLSLVLSLFLTLPYICETRMQPILSRIFFSTSSLPLGCVLAA